MLRSRLESIFEAAATAISANRSALPGIEISEPRDPSHGDFACNFALAASKALGKPPREVAETLVASLPENDLIASTEIAGPGFINIRLKPEAIADCVGEILNLGADRLASSLSSNSSKLNINLEFVSVNPNGPITVGSGRGAAFGSTLGNVLEAAGHKVHREYYINDGVNSEQMRLFAESVRAAAHGLEIPESGYRGDYVKEVAVAIEANLDEIADRYARPPLSEKFEGGPKSFETIQRAVRSSFASGDIDWFRSTSEALMIDRQIEDLRSFSVQFDTWFSEQSLHADNVVDSCIHDLKSKGAADENRIRTKVKFAKGGAIEDVETETQDGEVDEEGDGADESAIKLAHSQNTLWLRSTKFGDDMDRVLRRKDGRLTYIASDVAYHKDKFKRGSKPDANGVFEPADKLITVLGPDHHGYIGRLHAVVGALLEESESPNLRSTEPLSKFEEKIYKSAAERDACHQALAEARAKLEVVIFQIVRFVKDGKPAPMRKRDGNIYSLRDLMAEIGRTAAPNEPEEEQMRIGKDVARFFYLMRSHDSHMDFDIDLATKQSDENPVFYCQYAHARICSVIRKAEEAGFSPSTPPRGKEGEGGGEYNLLQHEREMTLIKKIIDLPLEVQRCAEDYGVHRLTTYAVELARTYHAFYDVCRVIQTDEPELTKARLALCEATKVGLQAVFNLLGVSAPERMDRESAA